MQSIDFANLNFLDIALSLKELSNLVFDSNIF